MMTPFTLPDQAKPRGLSSAPTLETFKVGGLLPGLSDIPYIEGNFAVGDSLQKACCTFWSPDTEDRLILAAGGCLQVLTFAKRPAVQSLSATMLGTEIPDAPVLIGVARYLYEKVHRSAWEAASPEAQENWKVLSTGAYEIFLHWYKATGRK